LALPELTLATLRFAAFGTIDPHAAGHEIDVVCLAGAGFVEVDGENAAVAPGDVVTWPAGLVHRLWTEGSTMETLMVEHTRPEA
jgi:quercetin dioxygenase-like cupin family protein